MKVMYMGATLNGKCAPWTKFLHKQKERVIDQQIEEAKKKTVYDQKKCMINDFFYLKCDNIPPPPPVHIDLSESEELEVASPPCSLSIQQQPSARDPMPEIEADIDVDDVDAPDVNTPSLHPWVPAPEREATARAADQLEKVLRPPRNNGAGHKDPNLDLASWMRYEQMLMVLCTYSTKTTAFVKEKGWIEVSHWVLAAWNRGDSYASRLRKWCRAYMLDHKTLPKNIYGRWKSSILLMDEDLRNDIQMHLRGIGPYIAARDIVQFLSAPEMKSRLGLDKPVSVHTVQRWLHIMGYNWQNEKKGQYSDGHECKDVVDYRQRVFLPAFAGYAESMWKWDDNGEEEIPVSPPERHTVVWFHDESIFYAHDRRKVRWVHDSESAKPYAKGDGASLMIADFISADYGWL